VSFDHVGQAIQHASHLLAAEFGACGDLLEDLRFIELVFDGYIFFGHALEIH
jgi:hypothetical protein